MIDRDFRDQAASALRRFLDCTIDNIDFENEYPRVHPPEEDPALRAIEETVWHWYDDFTAQKLDGVHELSDDERALGERCVLFLKSDNKYEWRNDRFIPTDLLSTEFAGLTFPEQMTAYLNQSEGDVAVWPFFRRSDFESVARIATDDR